MKRSLTACLALLLILPSPGAFAGKTLTAIKQRGQISCGVSTGVAGFSASDAKGQWSGMDVDLCSALAASVLGDATKVKWVPLSSQQRFAALQAGEVDVLARNTSWTLTRDTSLGLQFAGISYFDGQGFMVARSTGVSSAKQLKGASICVQSGTTSEKNLNDYFRSLGIPFKPVVFDNFEASLKGFFSGRCQAYSTDLTSLASIRGSQAPKPADYLILPETISKEPLGPLVRRDDAEWFSIVRWSLFALLEAEEYGVTRANVDQQKNSANPAIQRLLGSGEDMGKLLQLDRDWAYRAIKAVGNYGEIYERNLGNQSPLKLPRGLNKLWNQGGLHYAPPIR